MFHLPDIPHDGWATRREQELHDLIHEFVRGLERNRVLLLTIVLGGRDLFRTRGADSLRYLRADRDVIDAVFGYLELLASRPARQVQLLKAMKQPDTWRDLMARERPYLEAALHEAQIAAKWSPFDAYVQRRPM
jgi:hypothetical protein